MKKTLTGMMFLFLTACSSSSNPVLDAVIGGMSVTQVEGYFDLDQKQEKEFEKEINKDLQRIQQQQLQEFAQAIRKFDVRVPVEKTDSEILSEVFDKLEVEYKKASGAFQNSAVHLVGMLRDEQFVHFEQQVRTEIQKARAEGVNPKNDELLARYKKQIKYWVGPTTVHQNHLLQQFVIKEPFPWKERMDNREKMLNQFLSNRRDPKKMRQFIEQFMTDYDSLRTTEYAEAMNGYEDRFKVFLNKFWTTLDYGQKQQLRVSLNKQAQEVERYVMNSHGVK
ncbi:DUF6279 family lipoprotein [Bdellovibrio sp. GT3]|uniref:DUF6279 family lipoprotein n=1 Tax=Bdellovibrio sp. GT3 TaxID=3136282 RepID=UPI0030F21179